MTEIWFYHLERQPLEAVLPLLLEKTLDRGWRAVVQAGSTERVEALDQLLWSYRDDSFLPHAAVQAGQSEHQPVLLTAGDENPNGAGIRFLVDGADLASSEGYQRVIYIFDGNEPEALQRARAAWKRLKATGAELSYWQQSPEGGWSKKA